MQSTRLLSEAATRVLRDAGRLACSCSSRELDESHLLAALWRDESRAHELLGLAGMTDARLEQYVGSDLLEMNDTLPEPGEADSLMSTGVAHIIREAQSHAGQWGRSTEMGTEHLLMGLVSAAGPLAQKLAEEGVTLDFLQQQSADESGFVTDPIPVDIALSPTVITRQSTTETDRILDAAVNRCREGLRVVEEYTRFVLDDAHLARLLKELRHDLAAALTILPAGRLLRSRDTPGDVGTHIDTSAERQRLSPHHVAQANAKRVEESLRTLEEYGKVIDAEFAARCEALRYRFYNTEQAIATTHSARERLSGCRLYLLATDRNCPRGAGPLIRAALAGGVDAVQIREKDMPDRRLLHLARCVREWAHESGALCIVNDRPDIAALVHADAVHLGQDDLTAREARRIVGPDVLVGVSTHSIEQARQAVLDGADYLGVGPTFPSQTKAFSELAGLDFVRQVANEITLPWFAIGGITPQNIEQVISAGARRVAVSAALSQSANPEEAARSLRAALS